MPGTNAVAPSSVEIALKYSKASRVRMAAMKTALRKIDAIGIEGDVVECGVWRGGHIILARLISPDRHCWLYDTFEGMTEAGPLDRKNNGRYLNKPAGSLRVALWDVQDHFRAEGVLDFEKLTFVKGRVEQTLLNPANLPEAIALLRLDTDWYESTKIELEILYPKLVPGGVLIVDDYGHWLGARKAVNDYFGKKIKYLQRIDYTAVMLIKDN